MEIEQLKDIKEGRADIMCLRWSPDDAYIATGGSDGVIRIYNSASFRRIKHLINRTKSCMPVSYISWHPELKDRILSVNSDGWLVDWNVQSASIQRSFKLEGEQGTVCEYSPSGEFFAAACRDCSLKIFDSDTFEVKYTLGHSSGELLGHSNKIFAVKWINEHFIISGGWDRTLYLWDIDDLKPKNVYFGANICGESLDIKDDTLLAGAYDRTQQIQQFDLETLEKERDFTLQFDDKFTLIYASKFCKTPGKQFYAIVGSEIRVFLSDDLTVSEELPIPNNAYCCDWAHNEDILVVGGTEGKIFIFAVQK